MQPSNPQEDYQLFEYLYKCTRWSLYVEYIKDVFEHYVSKHRLELVSVCIDRSCSLQLDQCWKQKRSWQCLYLKRFHHTDTVVTGDWIGGHYFHCLRTWSHRLQQIHKFVSWKQICILINLLKLRLPPNPAFDLSAKLRYLYLREFAVSEPSFTTDGRYSVICHKFICSISRHYHLKINLLKLIVLCVFSCFRNYVSQTLLFIEPVISFHSFHSFRNHVYR